MRLEILITDEAWLGWLVLVQYPNVPCQILHLSRREKKNDFSFTSLGSCTVVVGMYALNSDFFHSDLVEEFPAIDALPFGVRTHEVRNDSRRVGVRVVAALLRTLRPSGARDGRQHVHARVRQQVSRHLGGAAANVVVEKKMRKGFLRPSTYLVIRLEESPALSAQPVGFVVRGVAPLQVQGQSLGAARGEEAVLDRTGGTVIS